MTDTEETLLGARIREIDETPAVWKAIGMLAVAITFFGTFHGLPLPLFPAPVGDQLGVTTHPVYPALLVLVAPLFIAMGIYSGHVCHKLFRPDRSDRQ